MSETKKETTTNKAIEKKPDAPITGFDAEGGFDPSQLKSKRTLADALKAGAWSEQFVTLDEGDCIEGFFLGRGTDTMVGDQDNKRLVSTWLFKHADVNVVMRILGAQVMAAGVSGLDQDLASKPLGAFLIVEKMEQVDIGGGRRANRWGVAVDPSKKPIDIAKYVRSSNIIAGQLALPAGQSNGKGTENASA